MQNRTGFRSCFLLKPKSLFREIRENLSDKINKPKQSKTKSRVMLKLRIRKQLPFLQLANLSFECYNNPYT